MLPQNRCILLFCWGVYHFVCQGRTQLHITVSPNVPSENPFPLSLRQNLSHIRIGAGDVFLVEWAVLSLSISLCMIEREVSSRKAVKEKFTVSSVFGLVQISMPYVVIVFGSENVSVLVWLQSNGLSVRVKNK
jgi:hypothetical protein